MTRWPRRSPRCVLRFGDARAPPTRPTPVVLDIDASLVEIHTETKEGTGPHYKGGWGFHPMFCFADVSGEALSGVLRPGNADGQHGGRPRARPRRGGGPVARRDRPGARRRRRRRTRHPAPRGAHRLGGMHAGFCPGRSGPQHRVLRRGPLKCPGPQCDLRHRRSRRDLGTGPATRREPSRGGGGGRPLRPRRPERLARGNAPDRAPRAAASGRPAQPVPSVSSTATGVTTATRTAKRSNSTRPCVPTPRSSCTFQRLKDSGLLAFPFSDLEANRTWMATVMMAADLVRWFQLLCLDGHLGQGTTQGLALGPVPRSGSPRANGATPRRAHPERLAQCRRVARRLSKTRPHRLIDRQRPASRHPW